MCAAGKKVRSTAGNMGSRPICVKALVLVLVVGTFSLSESAAFVGLGKVRALSLQYLALLPDHRCSFVNHLPDISVARL